MKQDNIINTYSKLTVRGSKTKFKKFFAKETNRTITSVGRWMENGEIPLDVKEGDLDSGIKFLQNLSMLELEVNGHKQVKP